MSIDGMTSVVRPVAPPMPAPGILLARGVCRAMVLRGWSTLTEVTLANGRRADVLMVDAAGNIAIIEVKSSIADFAADRKWPDYMEFCDALSFAVPETFPHELIPDACGLIVADHFGAEIIRHAPRTELKPARRRAMLLRFAQLAAARLIRHTDPHGVL